MLDSFLNSIHFDLITPDGKIVSITMIGEDQAEAVVRIEGISLAFVGYQIPLEKVYFNIKSSLAQLGVNGMGTEIMFDETRLFAEVKVHLHAYGEIARTMLHLLAPGAYIGKLFAADERRRVRDPDYLSRMFGRSDRKGRPLLSLGGLQGSDDLILEKVEGRTIAYLSLREGCVTYDRSILGFLPTLAKALVERVPLRDTLKLHQLWNPEQPRVAQKGEILLVKTLPLHIRTVFGRVVDSLLSKGYHHTSANILQPDTYASGDIYEFYGDSEREITDVALEFYTLEPYREHVFFADRDQLQASLENPKTIFNAFKTAPQPKDEKAAVFVVKGTQLHDLQPDQWVKRVGRQHEFPGLSQGARQAALIERYIEHQPSYPFLKGIEDGSITSQGVLLSRYFPSPLMKRMLLGDLVLRCLRGIYFEIPSQHYGEFFSSEDRALLHDLEKFAIPVVWADEKSDKLLMFAQKTGHDSGLFVPLNDVDRFLKSTVFGIYGSNLLQGIFEDELKNLMRGVLALRSHVNHPLLQPDTPLSFLTGGGPGAMEVGNKVAKELGILSCANIVDFRPKTGGVVNEQKQNPYVEAKMTYRLDKLVERQAEFNLDFPIFLMGGYGTDFEYTLEEIRRKVGSTPANPILMFGDANYWKAKVTSRFKINLQIGTIQGSEWLSNCFYNIENAAQGLEIYEAFFNDRLPIGKGGPIYEAGFVLPNEWKKHILRK